MTFQELVQTRYSVRAYKDTPVEEEKLRLILEAGRLAPSARNQQPQRIYVAKSKESIQKIASVCRFTFGAPVMLVICYDLDRCWYNPMMPEYHSGETDAAVVCDQMMMQALDLRLGTCWVGHFNAQQISDVLELPKNHVVSAMLTIGYPAEDAEPGPRHWQKRDLADIVEEI